MSKRPTNAQREEVAKRAEFLCEYCLSQEKYSNSTFEVEHIISISKGGKTISQNLAFAFSGCNKHKSHRISALDKITKNEAAFYNPRKDIWSEHFSWNEDLTQIVGLTEKGRVTVSELKLNRQNVVNLRKILAAAGEHPPKLTT
jgi:5-methylcytosine-specific restriction endonuclease McrA